MSKEDARNVIELSRYLNSQEMSGEEEAIYDNDLEDALCLKVDDHLMDIESDKLLDAIGECKDEFSNFMRVAPRKDKPLFMSEALSEIEHFNWATEKLIDALVSRLRVSCLKEAEDHIR